MYALAEKRVCLFWKPGRSSVLSSKGRTTWSVSAGEIAAAKTRCLCCCLQLPRWSITKLALLMTPLALGKLAKLTPRLFLKCMDKSQSLSYFSNKTLMPSNQLSTFHQVASSFELLKQNTLNCLWTNIFLIFWRLSKIKGPPDSVRKSGLNQCLNLIQGSLSNLHICASFVLTCGKT